MPESHARALQPPYHQDRCTDDETSDTYRCPEGQRRRVARIKHTRGPPRRRYRASGAVGRAGPADGVGTRDRRHGRGMEIGPHDVTWRTPRAWMSTGEAQHGYPQRQQLVEPVFGIINEHQGARRFLLRGLANVAAEGTLLATAFNRRTRWRVWRAVVTNDVEPYDIVAGVPARRIGRRD